MSDNLTSKTLLDRAVDAMAALHRALEPIEDEEGIPAKVAPDAARAFVDALADIDYRRHRLIQPPCDPPSKALSTDFDRDLAAVDAIRNGYQVSDSNRVLLAFIDNLWHEYSRAQSELDKAADLVATLTTERNVAEARLSQPPVVPHDWIEDYAALLTTSLDIAARSGAQGLDEDVARVRFRQRAVDLWLKGVPATKPAVLVKNGYCTDCGGINEHYDHCLTKTGAVETNEPPKWKRVIEHLHICANVQPGSTYEDTCDCGAVVDGKPVTEFSQAYAGQLRAALCRILERSNDPVAISIAGEALLPVPSREPSSESAPPP